MAESSNPRAPAEVRRAQDGSLSPKGWIVDIFDRFLDSIEVGVYVLDCAGVIKRVNRFITDRYDWKPHELIGRNIFELMPDLGEAGVEEKFFRAIRERRVLELTNLKRKDHKGRDVVSNIKGIPIIEQGEVRGMIAAMNDITEKRVLETQVTETKEYLQNLIDSASDIIYTLDRDGYITFLNKMGQEVTGYTLEPGEKAHYTQYIVEKNLAEAEGHFRESIRGRPQRYATSIIGADGGLIHILLNTSPIRKDDEIVGVLGIAKDITERKQMEALLLQASKMAAIGELAAGVAHEINNPVGIISGTAEQLQFLIDRHRDQPELVAEKIVKHLETIYEQADRCKRITQGLLSFARRTEIRSTNVDLAGLVNETVSLLKNRAVTENKKIETRIDDGLPAPTADPHLLGQVFLTLVNNALDAVRENGTVTVAARGEGDAVIIEVADDGAGIAEENLKKIFDPFFTTKPIGKGTGLGLSICFGIVERMNGEISVDSTPGRGATFSVRLPLKQKRTPER